MHIVTLTTLFPNSLQPVHAVFIKNRMEVYTRKYHHEWTVVAPVPFYPRFPFSTIKEYDDFAKIPIYEELWGYPLYHPRYLVTPKIGMSFYGVWMYQGIRKTIKEIHRKKTINVIDAHYLYPDGFAAVLIGQELKIPVVLSARGTDLNSFPTIKSIRPKIQSAIKKCEHLICVSENLKSAAQSLQVADGKISVVGNGINPEVFKPLPQHACRNRLALPAQGNIFISVGRLVEMKGFQLIIDAFAHLRRENSYFVIVGDGSQKSSLVQLAEKYDLKKQIIFPGVVENSALPEWYGASDYYVLASKQEGWPNAVCEAQACGLPAIATKVGAVPEIINKDSLGIILEAGTQKCLTDAMNKMLDKNWNKDTVAAAGQTRTWSMVADLLEPLFRSIT